MHYILSSLKKTKSVLLGFLAIAGPSIITTMAGNDGGGVITYSLAGAQFGYGLLILLPFLTLVYGLTQEIGSRLAIVTGRGMADLIRERYGVKVAVLVFMLFFVANTGTLVTNAAAIKASLAMFGYSPSTVAFMALSIVIAISFVVTRFDYKTNQKVFLASMFLYVAYVISAVNSRPDWSVALKSLFIPLPSFMAPSAILASLAFVGTTITPWGQFFIQSFMKDKKLTTEHIPDSQKEAYIGAIISNVTTFFIVVATATALYDRGIPLINGDQAALAIKPFAGEFASALFGLGLLNAGIIGMIIVGLSTSYAFTEFFGFEGTLDTGYARGRNFYLLFYVQLCIAFFIVLSPHVSAFQVATYTQSLNGILLPAIFYFLIQLSGDQSLMGAQVVGPVRKILLLFSSFVIVSASIFSMIYSMFF